MKEKDFISIIKNTLNSKYIGDDCAYLKDLNITISQDSLIEDVHFSMKYYTPYQLGFKSIMVNISDVCASGAEPKYITIALSIPNNTDETFIKKFYQGCKDACDKNIEIVGGDITSSDKICVSVCAIGKTLNRNISSRKNAQNGYKVIISGAHGSSDIGLKLLQKGITEPKSITNTHLMPIAQKEFSKYISTNLSKKYKYAMMDTSDGLIDALFTISSESGVCLNIDFDKIPHDKEIENFNNWEHSLLFGGEDYGIIAVVPKDFDCPIGTEIGYVTEGTDIKLKKDNKIHIYTKNDIENNIYNHFGEKQC